MEQGKFHVDEQVSWRSNSKWGCFAERWQVFRPTRRGSIYFRCRNCNGKFHREHNKAPVELKHPLHPKHSLRLVLLQSRPPKETRECYCCDKQISQVFYYCSACDIAINFVCAKEQPVLLYIDRPKWHEHTLALFPSEASVTCNLCALVHATSCPFYTCPPCNFVVHESCLRLPRVIKISRHPQHRISFTPSFVQGNWVCGVCRRKINTDYGGYSCIKDACSFAAHSKCATQSNVWDGIDLEEVPEEIEEEELEPFETISEGIIQHFSHPDHHLRLDEDKERDYDENKLCQACIMPIYFGNFYSCMQCDFILHEACAKLPRKIYHPIHPHRLTLVVDFDRKKSCLACPWMYTAGFFYECDICETGFGEEFQYFMLHVQCATISEPLVHESHMDPLFLTSKPGEQRICLVCKELDHKHTETFNCIECDFALCFKCATLPQKVRYKHDKHELTLSYGKETSTMTYWCEVCERKINPKKRFYMCEEYCCVTLHVECLIGMDLYMKPGSSYSVQGRKIDVLPNNRHMCRPICRACKKRCLYKTALKFIGSIYCSNSCCFPWSK
uniref:Phorbol-ester/DAG-type domain-containing protein n=1 Tax=Noccaea caerulescens TaxID=107243 RepID=A0A1J3JT08_NOCCA